jgi:hypothetical protein
MRRGAATVTVSVALLLTFSGVAQAHPESWNTSLTLAANGTTVPKGTVDAA